MLEIKDIFDYTAKLSIPVTFADPARDDCPIVAANPAFQALTGYRSSEIVGRNCRFLQGDGTAQDAVARVKAAVARSESICECLLNYRRNGRAFHNLLFIEPIRLQDGGLLLMGCQYEFQTRNPKLREVEEHTRRVDDTVVNVDYLASAAYEQQFSSLILRSEAAAIAVNNYILARQMNLRRPGDD